MVGLCKTIWKTSELKKSVKPFLSLLCSDLLFTSLRDACDAVLWVTSVEVEPPYAFALFVSVVWPHIASEAFGLEPEAMMALCSWKTTRLCVTPISDAI